MQLLCKKCHIQLFEDSAEKDRGELIITCPMCSTENVLGPVLINKVALPVYQVIGYRDRAI